VQANAEDVFADVFAFDDVSVSFSAMELMRSGQPISLTYRIYDPEIHGVEPGTPPFARRTSA
jgi:hypothetical protein